jgi:quercetin dioxygenase-like cupin family protein
MTLRPALYRWDELSLDKVTEMVARKVIAGAETTLVQAYFKKGTLVPRHRHAVEVVVYVLQGALRVRIGDEDVTVREGEVVFLPRERTHQAECLDDTFVLTIAQNGPGSSAGH